MLWNPFNDEVEVEWEKNNQSVKDVKDSHLHIDRAEQQHCGVYTCTCKDNNNKKETIKVDVDNTGKEFYNK